MVHTYQPKYENSKDKEEKIIKVKELKEQTKLESTTKIETETLTWTEKIHKEVLARTFSFILSLNDENFLIKRYFYFHILLLSFITLFFALIIYDYERNFSKISFFDTIFMTASTVTQTGLITFDFSLISLTSQVLFLLTNVFGLFTITTIPLMFIKMRYTYKKMIEKRQYLRLGDICIEEVRFYGECISFIVLFMSTHGILIPCSVFFGIYLEVVYSASKLNGLSPFYIGFQMTYSAWGNLGITPFPDSVIKFKYDYIVLFYLSIITLLGITFYPLVYLAILRLGMFLFRESRLSISFEYILEQHHHFNVFIYPEQQTLLFVLMASVSHFISVISCLIFERDNTEFSGHFFYKIVLCGFLSTCSRSGFGIVNLANISIPYACILFFQMRTKPQMMTSLEEYFDDPDYKIALNDKAFKRIEKIRNAEKNNPPKRQLTVFTKLQDSIIENWKRYVKDSIYKLYHELLSLTKSTNFWLISLTILIAAIDNKLVEKDKNITLFRIGFEVISAFGNTGLSYGYPDTVLSLTAALSRLSQVVMIIIMFIGRHRGLNGGFNDQAKRLPFHPNLPNYIEDKKLNIFRMIRSNEIVPQEDPNEKGIIQ